MPLDTHSSIDQGANYTDEERQFLQAIDAYQRQRRRPFPSFTEILAVARSLGYRRVAAAEALPPSPLAARRQGQV